MVETCSMANLSAERLPDMDRTDSYVIIPNYHELSAILQSVITQQHDGPFTSKKIATHQSSHQKKSRFSNVQSESAPCCPSPGISLLPLSPLLVQIDLPTPGWWDKYCSGWHPLFYDNNIVLVLDTNMISWWKHKIGSWTSHVLGMTTRAVRDIVWCWKASVCWVEKHVLLIVNHKFVCVCVLENKLCWWFEPQ